MREFIKKHDKILIICIIIFISLAQTLYVKMIPGDLLWNFGNIYKLFIGEKIYSDVNIIDTPIFFVFGKILFKIMGANYITYAIYGTIISTILYYIAYKILRKLNINKKISILTIILMIIFTKDSVIKAGANYNTLAFTVYEIGILYLLNNFNKKENNLIQGTIISIILLISQKLGTGYVVAYIIYTLIKEKKKKIQIINILKTGIISFVEIIIFLTIEYLQNNLYDFINLCILGIREFKQNGVFSIDTLKLIIIELLIFIFSIILIKKIKDEDLKKKIKLMLSFAFCANILIIPIVNGYHITVASILWVILVVFEINYCLNDIIKEKAINVTINILAVISIIYIVISSAFSLYKYMKYINQSSITESYTQPFYGAIIDDDTKKNMKDVSSYIQKQKDSGTEVLVLSDYAMLYTINPRINNGYFDLPLRGNLGANGENHLIQQIKNMKNVKVLVANKEKTIYENYQFADDIRNYIIQNYKKIDEIENYEIYQI